ncbi:hypothetical protein D3C80_1714570 [compost metagenome]
MVHPDQGHSDTIKANPRRSGHDRLVMKYPKYLNSSCQSREHTTDKHGFNYITPHIHPGILSSIRIEAYSTKLIALFALP